MSMHNHRAFLPAIYCCSWCDITCHGDTDHLPMGWDKCIHPKDNSALLSCPDCNQRIEQEFSAAAALIETGPVSATAIMGRVAANYAGGLSS